MDSDDPETPKLRLHLLAEILVDVEVNPRYLRLGRLGKNETAVGEFTVKIARPAEIHISSVTVLDQRFEVERLEDSSDGEAKYRVRFLGSERVESVSSSVTVAYEGSASGSVQLRLLASVENALSYPRSIHFIKSANGFPHRRIVIRSLARKSVKINKVEDSGGMLDVRIIQREGRLVVIEARVARPDDSYVKATSHKLVITTDEPTQPTVEIAYSISESRRAGSR